MIIFENMGLKLVNANKPKTSNTANIVFSVRVDKEKRKSLVFNLSDELIKELKWENVQRVNIFSDGAQSIGISNSIDPTSVSYQLIKNTDKSSRREIKITWKNHITKEPINLEKINIKYNILSNEGITGIKFDLPNSIFEGV